MVTTLITIASMKRAWICQERVLSVILVLHSIIMFRVKKSVVLGEPGYFKW